MKRAGLTCAPASSSASRRNRRSQWTVATRKEANAKSLTLSFVVDATPMEVFDAVVNVRGWWTSEIKGKSAQVGDVFTYRYGDIHRSTQRLVEVVPGKKVVWYVEDAFLSFTEDKEEWKGTVVEFLITPRARRPSFALRTKASCRRSSASTHARKAGVST